MSISEVISDWPAILQGLLGSALFMGIVAVVPKAASIVMLVMAKLSKGRRIAYLRSRIWRLGAVISDGESSSIFYTSILWHRASRDLIKGLIWLTLGLLLQSNIGILGMVGYLGALYHLFFALEVVKPMQESQEEAKMEMRKLQMQLKKLSPKEYEASRPK